MGPVLFFRGCRDGAWRLSALTVNEADSPAEALRTGGERIWPELLAERRGKKVWRHDFSVPLGEKASLREYSIGGRSWNIQVPALAGGLRLAFTACNGSEQGETWTRSQDRNRLWLELAAEHERKPFHLLIQGGDQLYADPVWKKVPGLAEWRRRPWLRRRRSFMPPQTAEAIRDFYFDAYCELWGKDQLAPVLARIPSLMMWDDHDIFDGWGSYPESWHKSALFQGIWTAAREHFALFQLGARADDLPEGFSDPDGGHFGWAYRIGDVGVIAPDLRSERSRRQVMGEAGRRAFHAALEGMADCHDILLISTVPLVNAHFGALERTFRWVPGHQNWQDDIIDQWPSLAHWEEWSELLRRLVSFSSRTGARITALSGEIHMGAFGVVESPAANIVQLTSSGIVHPPPPKKVVATLDWVSSRVLRVEPDITAKLLRIPGLERRYLRSRNWLELELPAGDGIRAAWHPESAPMIETTFGTPSASRGAKRAQSVPPSEAEAVSGPAARQRSDPEGRRRRPA